MPWGNVGASRAHPGAGARGREDVRWARRKNETSSANRRASAWPCATRPDPTGLFSPPTQEDFNAVAKRMVFHYLLPFRKRACIPVAQHVSAEKRPQKITRTIQSEQERCLSWSCSTTRGINVVVLFSFEGQTGPRGGGLGTSRATLWKGWSGALPCFRGATRQVGRGSTLPGSSSVGCVGRTPRQGVGRGGRRGF